MSKGVLVVFSGPSGCGKDTILHHYLGGREDVFLSISATTRSPRPGEVDGVSYFFLSEEQFKEKIAHDGMLEYACYNGNFYGTPLDKVDEWLALGCDVLLEIEVQGARQVKEKRQDAILIFLVPPSMAEAELRLRGRNSESEDTLKARIATSRQELEQAQYYDYVVVNSTVDRSICDIEAILRAEHLRFTSMAGFVCALMNEMTL